VTTTVGLGSGWLTYRVQDFQALYPEVQVHLMLDNEELDSTCARPIAPSGCASRSSPT
jgi:DNA-binding transcriptional LysR family regulator